MKAVVFGGSGFLGSYVADALTEVRHSVTVFDLEPSLYLKKPQKMIVGSLLDEKAVSRAVKGADVVYNFAGIADIDQANKHPLDSVRFNVLGNSIILEACRKERIKRFVFASSIYVYSEKGSFYRSTKQACELFIENYHERFGMPYTILRYGSVYGPRADENNWIYRILKEALGDNKITRYGDGEEIREYIHAKDAAQCSVEILDSEYKNQYVIIAGHQQIKIKDLLVMVKEIMRNKPRIEYKPFEHKQCPYDPKLHYEITPYIFKPKLGLKIIRRNYIDLGQGIIELLNEIYKEGFLNSSFALKKNK